MASATRWNTARSAARPLVFSLLGYWHLRRVSPAAEIGVAQKERMAVAA